MHPTQVGAQANVDPVEVSKQVYTGWKYFQVYCSRCHGDHALGTMDGPDLNYAVNEEGSVSADSFKVVVRDGSLAPGRPRRAAPAP